MLGNSAVAVDVKKDFNVFFPDGPLEPCYYATAFILGLIKRCCQAFAFVPVFVLVSVFVDENEYEIDL